MHRIMIVEDDAMIQQVFTEILRSQDYETSVCSTAAQGREQAPLQKPDLILLDMNLPDGTGLEVCRALKADPATRHIPVLILTGEAREVATRVAGLEVGAEDYLFKPIDTAVLLSRIRSILKQAVKPS